MGMENNTSAHNEHKISEAAQIFQQVKVSHLL